MANTNKNKFAPTCPNPASGPHNTSTATNGRLSRAQLRTALATIDIGPGSRLLRYAGYRGWMADIEADDLLQEALLRALSSRSCPASITVEVFLKGIMRLIASAALETREREIDVQISEADFLGHAVADLAQPDEILDREERQLVCATALQNICEGSRRAAIVLDGIDQGLRGLELADHAGIGTTELATVRRLIKRRAVAFWKDLGEDEDIAA